MRKLDARQITENAVISDAPTAIPFSLMTPTNFEVI